MKFGFFHLMLYADFSTPEGGWPVRNDRLDPNRAAELYSRYIETLVFAEECGFDWIGLNEHHFSPYGLMANPNVAGGALAYRTKTVKIAVCGPNACRSPSTVSTTSFRRSRFGLGRFSNPIRRC